MKNALTYEAFMALAKQNYNKGGDEYVECWDEMVFNWYVAEAGPISKTKALRMFKHSYEIQLEERADAAYYRSMGA